MCHGEDSMNDRTRRKVLTNNYKQSGPEAGVYRIINLRTNRFLIGSTQNLASVRGKLDFARATNTPSALDRRLAEDFRQFGPDAFSLEILEVLEITPVMTETRIREDLATLEALWIEQLGGSAAY